MIEFLQDFVNTISGPKISFFLMILIFWFTVWKAGLWTKNKFAIITTICILIAFIFSMFNTHFRHMVLKPDNIPIVAMIFLVMFLPIQIVFPSLFRERDVHESSSSFLLKTVPFSAASMDAIRRFAFAGLLSR